MRVFELPLRLISSQSQPLLSSRCIALVDMDRWVPYREESQSRNCTGFRGLPSLVHRSQTTRKIDPESLSAQLVAKVTYLACSRRDFVRLTIVETLRMGVQLSQIS